MDYERTHVDMPSRSDLVPLREVAVKVHRRDNVAIAKTELQVGVTMVLEPDPEAQNLVAVRQRIPVGHKVALQSIAVGEPVRRYGQIIGLACRQILPGEHVHTHNLGLERFERWPAPGVDMRPVQSESEVKRRTFLGYKRPDGRVGTRNYIAVISTVNCSAHVAREIAHHFTSERLASFPNVDGVVAFTHQTGCTFRTGGNDHTLLQRTLAGIARHPNVGVYLMVGLGCEVNQIDDLSERCSLCIPDGQRLVIQELGGIGRTVQAGIAAVQRLLPVLNVAERSVQPVSELMLALQCGGSDGWSGVTANPVVGLVADELVRQGGTVVLAETPEIYGAEHLLTGRAITPEVGQRLMAKVKWWEAHAKKMGTLVDDNRGVGNEAGGLTTIYEKSLGAVVKAGSTPLVDVYDYAETVTARGVVFMNTPGNDPIAVTGQVAGGCNLVLFTTGRGSVFGFKPAPSIKISSNSAIYEWMSEDMDLNAGRLLGGAAIEDVAAELLDLVVAVASGQPSKSEAQGVGEAEFCPWYLGEML
jgi:altronate hydrolase